MFDAQKTNQLIRLAKAGDNSAKEALLSENVNLMKSIVKRYLNKGVEYDDLMQLAGMGLLKAINGFDESFGVRFSTYAVPMIAGEIKRFLRDDGAVKVSRWAKTLSAKIAAYLDEVAKGGGAQPTVDELAEKFGCERCDIVFALDTSRFVVSLSDDSGEDGAPLEDRIAGGSTPEDGIDELMLRESIMQLPERERKIIFLRYYRDKTQSEVAGELGVSQVQVSRLENKILCKIREKMDAGE